MDALMPVNVYWFNPREKQGFHNFGDTLNPVLIEKLCGVKVLWADCNDWKNYKKFYMAIGSILGKAKPNTIVWGTGFGSESNNLNRPPLKICAVRGPMTREKLLSLGLSCPGVYGDPALLLPRIYNPTMGKTHKLGIIPHYVDRNNEWIKTTGSNRDVKRINVQDKNVLSIIDDILSCELIASSSLHGIVAADAYGIPSLWLKFSDKVLGKGFKFRDYFRSVHRKVEEPLVVTGNTTLSQVFDGFSDYRIDIDLEKLYEVCPFGDGEQ
jgi:pyruvyltransferase